MDIISKDKLKPFNSISNPMGNKYNCSLGRMFVLPSGGVLGSVGFLGVLGLKLLCWNKPFGFMVRKDLNSLFGGY